MDISFFLPLVIQSALVPFTVAIVTLFLLTRSSFQRLAAPVAILLAFLASYFLVFQDQWTPVPRQALDWLFWIGLLALPGAVLVERVQHGGVRILLRAILACAAIVMVIWPLLQQGEPQQHATVIAVSVILIAAAWTLLAREAQRGPMPPVLLTIVAGGAALALMIDASQMIGQLLGALAMACAGCAAFNLGRRRAYFNEAATGLALIVLGALVANAFVYADFSIVYVVLLAAGLLGSVLAEALLRLFGKESGGAASWVASLLLSGLPVLVAIGLAVKSAQDSGGY